jgi:hypothetical protein
MLALAPAANAAFGLSGAAANPASTDAGANANFTLAFDTPDSAEDIKDLTIPGDPAEVQAQDPRRSRQDHQADRPRKVAGPAS